MARFAKSSIALRSDNHGWLLVTVLVFVLIIQASAIVTLTLVRYGLISSSVFRDILQQTDMAAGGDAVVNRTRHTAPEGWDHAVFLTEIRERTHGTDIQIRNVDWRIVLKAQFYDYLPTVMLASLRPHVLVLVDDSESFGWSSGLSYAEARIYLKRPSGEVVLADFDLGEADFLDQDEGIYFKGSYGNTAMRAPFAEYYGGAMPCSTYYFPLVRQLIDATALCEIALGTTSQGIVQPFTHDPAAIRSAFAGLHLGTGASKLSETLYASLAAFPPQCVTDRHIVFVTDGEALDDGNLPAAIQDFDHDGNPLDTYVAGIGSHCLDDVSAYAASQNVHVHTMGPERAFLRQVAEKGAGAYLPGPDVFFNASPFVTLIPVVSQGERLFHVNTFARFNPSWLLEENARYYTIDAADNLVVSPPFTVTGPASHACLDGSTLFTTTTGDCLLSIDLPTRRLNWVIRGAGGKILIRNTTVLVGPNTNGRIVALKSAPLLQWISQGQIMDASESIVYISQGNLILGVDIPSGIVVGGHTSTEEISALAFDPCQGLLLAGTIAGTVLVLTQNLVSMGLVATGLSERIHDLRAFHARKTPYVIAVMEHHLAALSTTAVLWSIALDNGKPLQALVLDHKIYLTTWQEDEPCGGIDTGRSYLMIGDALSGVSISQRSLFNGRAFGPLIDLTSGRLIFTNYAMAVQEEDITGLAGVRACPLGTQIRRQ